MKTSKQEKGRRGEDEACRYLKDMGHRIIATNWRYSHLEIDIVSLKGDGLHFVEVKSRTAPVMAAPELNVGPQKQRRLTAAANAFLNSKDRGELPKGMEVHFDVLTVIFDRTYFEIEYYPQAFVPKYV